MLRTHCSVGALLGPRVIEASPPKVHSPAAASAPPPGTAGPGTAGPGDRDLVGDRPLMGGVVLMGGVLRPVPGGVVCRDWPPGPGEHASRPGVSPNVSRISSAGIPASRMGGGGGCSSGARPGSSAWRPPPTRSTAEFAKLGVGQPKLPVLLQVMLRSRLLASRFRPQGGGGGGIFRGEVRLGEREGGRAASADCAREPRFSPKPGPGERPDLLMGGSPGDSPLVVCLGDLTCFWIEALGWSGDCSPVFAEAQGPWQGQRCRGILVRATPSGGQLGKLGTPAGATLTADSDKGCWRFLQAWGWQGQIWQGLWHGALARAAFSKIRKACQ